MGLQGHSLAPVCDAPPRDSTPLRNPRGRQKQPSPTGLTGSGARLQVGPPSAPWLHVRDRATWLPAPARGSPRPCLPRCLGLGRQGEPGFGGKSSTKLHENGVWPGSGPRCWERRDSRLGCAGPAERKCALRDHAEGSKGGGRGPRPRSSARPSAPPAGAAATMQRRPPPLFAAAQALGVRECAPWTPASPRVRPRVRDGRGPGEETPGVGCEGLSPGRPWQSRLLRSLQPAQSV